MGVNDTNDMDDVNGIDGSGAPAPEQRFQKQLRWYPAAWRARYGSELAALLEDTHGDRPLARPERWALARAGLAERARVAWSDAHWSNRADRVRDAAGLVLWGWACTIVGGIAFAKVAEHWESAVPVEQHTVPAAAYGAVTVAAATGALVIAVAVALSLPAFLRFVRTGRWSSIRVPVAIAIMCTFCTLVGGAALAAWAHHLTPADRNGGSTPYSAAALIGATLLATTIVAWTNAALRAAASVDLEARVVRALGVLSLALAGVIGAVFSGVVLWWVAVASDAAWFLGGTRRGSHPVPLPTELVVGAVLLALGAVLAGRGAWRVVGGLRPAHAS